MPDQVAQHWWTTLPSLKCTPGTSNKAAGAYTKSLVAASLYVDYVFLDTDERRRMAQNPHEYLIEQLQFTGDESVGSSSNKIKLNFNHPCKELVFVVQKDALVDYCSSFLCRTMLYNILGAQPFNYTDCVDAVPNAQHAYSGPAAASGALLSSAPVTSLRTQVRLILYMPSANPWACFTIRQRWCRQPGGGPRTHHLVRELTVTCIRRRFIRARRDCPSPSLLG